MRLGRPYGPRRAIVAALLALGLPAATVGAATARLFVWPATDGAPAAADAVVVLAGDYGDRLLRGLELMAQGVAPTLVLDGEADFQLAANLCSARMAFEIVCLRPKPDRTRTEAAAAAELAAARGWRHVVVVTSTPHVTRAGLLFRRCMAAPVEVHVAGSTPPYGPRKRAQGIAHEWLSLTWSMLAERAC